MTKNVDPAVISPVHVGKPNVGSRDRFFQLAGEMFDRGWLSNDGPLVQEFERKIAAYLGVEHCVAICNGTIALEILIRALGMTGEVIVPSYTFIATAHALHWQDITPVFADIDPLTHNLDPEAVRRMITPRTTGIIGVHLWGRSAPAEALESIASEFGLKLIFDAAHAFGCSRNGKTIGGFGRAEVLSFHATKFFNTFEGGAIVTNDGQLAEKARLMRNFGFAGLDRVIHAGTNGKMPEICAAMGLANLESLDGFLDANRRSYQAYQAGLAGISGLRLLQYDWNERNNFQYVVIEVGPESAAGRNEIVDALRSRNILARKYFWPGCHGMEPYRNLFPLAGLGLPNTIRIAEQVVVLPTGTNVSVEQIAWITGLIRRLATAGPANL